MTISTLMRRTVAIGATAIAVFAVTAGPALAAAPLASVPGHVLAKQGSYAADHDAAVAQVRDYELVTATTASAGTVSPHATGGGCSKGSIIASACISVSGSQVLPDAYVNYLPFGCNNIFYFVWDLTAGALKVNLSLGCFTGHFGPFNFTGTPGHRYQSSLYYYYGTYNDHLTFQSPISNF